MKCHSFDDYYVQTNRIESFSEIKTFNVISCRMSIIYGEHGLFRWLRSFGHGFRDVCSRIFEFIFSHVIQVTMTFEESQLVRKKIKFLFIANPHLLGRIFAHLVQQESQ